MFLFASATPPAPAAENDTAVPTGSDRFRLCKDSIEGTVEKFDLSQECGLGWGFELQEEVFNL